MAKTAESTEVAIPQSHTGLMVLDDSMLEEVQGVAGVGMSDNPEDQGVPRLNIAQKGSKQVNKKHSLYIEGLEVGMCFNNLTGRFWDTENVPLRILPCFLRAEWLHWTPIEAGGGFHGSYHRNDPFIQRGTPRKSKKADGKPRRDVLDLPDGTELIYTHQYFCLMADTMSPIVIGMSSSNLGASSRLQGMIGDQKAQAGGRIITLPAYFNTYSLKTAYESNESGDWYMYAPSIAGPTTDRSVRDACKELAIMARDSTIQVSAPDAGEVGNTNAGGVGSVELDDEIPI